MKRAFLILLASLAMMLSSASTARADLTAFWGVSPSPVKHSTRGVALGISLLVIGFEGEYGSTTENVVNGVPGLRTGMINGLVQTPTRTQFYVTAGGGIYRAQLGLTHDTSVATNVGGGIKIGLAGPLRVRLDYRIFNLRGSHFPKNPQRFYAGLNLTF